MKRLLIALITLALLTACSSTSQDEQQARQALVDFFGNLNAGEYEKAAELYGGSYEILVDFNPALDPENRPALLKNGCEINGLQCLTVLTADFKEINAEGEYVFVVQFKNADGKLFVQQPPNTQPVFIFEYRVQKTSEDNFVVLDLPVYVP
jgi:hypothetical protein